MAVQLAEGDQVGVLPGVGRRTHRGSSGAAVRAVVERLLLRDGLLLRLRLRRRGRVPASGPQAAGRSRGGQQRCHAADADLHAAAAQGRRGGAPRGPGHGKVTVRIRAKDDRPPGQPGTPGKCTARLAGPLDTVPGRSAVRRPMEEIPMPKANKTHVAVAASAASSSPARTSKGQGKRLHDPPVGSQGPEPGLVRSRGRRDAAARTRSRLPPPSRPKADLGRLRIERGSGPVRKVGRVRGFPWLTVAGRGGASSRLGFLFREADRSGWSLRSSDDQSVSTTARAHEGRAGPGHRRATSASNGYIVADRHCLARHRALRPARSS